MTELGEIAGKVRQIRAEIDAAAGGRKVCLVAATKMNDKDRVRAAVTAGVDVCGENRVQELLEKNAQGAYAGVPLHFIGHLQKNKVRQIVGLVELIQSVDSAELMALIDRAAAAKGIVQDVLVEINIGGEEAKSGIAPEELPALLEQAGAFSHIRVRGLMAIPPKCVSPEENKPYFLAMNQLFIDNSRKKYDNIYMDFLSMGMSNDYALAVACGANMVRVGSAIFGQRVYPDRDNSNSTEA